MFDASDIAETAAARAQEIEGAGRIPADLSARIAQSGGYRLLAPESAGGLQLSPAEFALAVRRIGAGDASTAWCVMNSATAGLATAFLPPDLARSMLEDPGFAMAGVYAPMGRGVATAQGALVSGHWDWASNALNATWLIAGAVISDSDRKFARQVIVPAKAADLSGDWRVSGLKGTGSGPMALRDVAVDADRMINMLSDPPRAAGALYRFPLFCTLSAGVASAMIGVAEGALDALVAAIAPDGAPGWRARRGAVQAELGGLLARRAAAATYLADALERHFATVAAGDPLHPTDRADLRLAACHGAAEAVAITRIAHDLAGAGAIFLDHPLQRALRDISVMRQHVMVAPAIAELVARVRLGEEIGPDKL